MCNLLTVWPTPAQLSRDNAYHSWAIFSKSRIWNMSFWNLHRTSTNWLVAVHFSVKSVPWHRHDQLSEAELCMKTGLNQVSICSDTGLSHIRARPLSEPRPACYWLDHWVSVDFGWKKKHSILFLVRESNWKYCLCVSASLFPTHCTMSLWTERRVHTHRVRRRFVNVLSPNSRYRKSNTHCMVWKHFHDHVWGHKRYYMFTC